MHHRTVSDLMSHSVVSVGRKASFKEIAGLLAEHDITAVPVVDDDGRPLGVVSEADLLSREARQPDLSGRLPDLLGRYVEHSDDQRAAGPGSDAMDAEGLMTAPVVVAHPQWSVVEAARTMQEHEVKRLPVVDETDKLIGLISRADLLRVFLRRDRAIREEISDDILRDTLRIAPDEVTAHVVEGRVNLTGTVERDSTVPVLVRLCRSIDGVVDVSEELRRRQDDPHHDGLRPTG